MSASQHEARHAAAALMRDVPVLEAALDACGGGHVIPDLRFHRDELRSFALLVLAGRLGDPGWPPTWPQKGAPTRDERMLAVLAEHLGLDESGWRELIAEAWRLTATPPFERLVQAIETLLGEHGTLDAQTLARLHEIATKEPDRAA